VRLLFLRGKKGAAPSIPSLFLLLSSEGFPSTGLDLSGPGSRAFWLLAVFPAVARTPDRLRADCVSQIGRSFLSEHHAVR